MSSAFQAQPRVHLHDIKPGMIVSFHANNTNESRQQRLLVTGVHHFTLKTKTANGKPGKWNGRDAIRVYMKFMGDEGELGHEFDQAHLTTSVVS